MKKMNNLIGNAPGARAPCSNPVCRFCVGLVVIVLWAALVPARAQEADELYLQAFNVIQQADEMAQGGQNAPALAKYRDAQSILLTIKQDHPAFNPQAIAFRLSYVRGKIATLEEKPAAPPPGGGAAAAASEKPAAAETAAAQEGAVKLLEAGTEPRKALRLHPKAGDKQTSTMTVKLNMEQQITGAPSQGIKLPPIKIVVDTTVTSVSPEGEIAYERTITEAGLAESPEVKPEIAELAKGLFGRMKGLSGTGKISERGIDKGVEIKGAAGSDPITRQATEQMKELFSSPALPLPEQAVGAGAKWEVKTKEKSEGLTIDQTQNWELVSMEGERITVKGTVSQTAANQKVQNPALQGVSMDLSKLTGKGTASATLDLGQAVTQEAAADLHVESTMSASMGGQKRTISSKRDVSVQIETK